MTSTAPAQSTLAATATLDGTRSLARNAGALFAGQLVALVVPLLTVPYLARVLGPSGWGPVLAAQALGNWLVLVLEFGFDLSGTRAVARARTMPHTMSDVVHGTQSAKTLLAPAAVLAGLIAFVAIPTLRNDPLLVWCTVAFAVVRGFSPLWFFQGIERVQGAVAVDAAARAAAALAVFVFVRTSGDGWRVLALQAVFSTVSLVVLTMWLSRHVPLRAPRIDAAVRTLREASSIFACRASSGLYIQANALILSMFASAATVAFFGGAERIIRAAINLLQPLTQAFLPRLSYLQASDPAAARRTIRHALVGLGLLGGAMGLVAFVGAPLLVHVLLGPEYASAASVLRMLGLLPPLVAVNTVLGVYWALPFGHDRAFLVAIVSAG
ncbi:MAG TPA: oligosaccharide flippase family protein, partial [Gemmatimonadaceae bacterium]